MVGALWLARGMVRPIRTLDEGARRIGAGDLDQQIVVRTGDELEGLADQFNRMTARLRESYAGLERKVEERTTELTEALEQQKASAEVLGVISSSISDANPVFDKILQQLPASLRRTHRRRRPGRRGRHDPSGRFAGRRCSRSDIARSSRCRWIASRAPAARSSSVASCTIQTRARATCRPASSADGRRSDSRSVLFAPLLLEGRALGALWVGRKAQAPFSDKQIGMLKTFADQAVIAIENARLFNETKEALEQQTAISEILRVISGSPTDVHPMLDAIAERALRLCDAAQSGILLVEGDKLRFATGFGTMPIFEAGEVLTLSRDLVVGRSIIDRVTLHYADLVPLLDTEYPDARKHQERFGFRAILTVPLMREDRAIGAIILWRPEAKAFTDKQVALVKTFADQAALAIENVRLFNETKEALEQQTAISEILRVISSSPTDVQPVLEAIADRAARLCDASVASMYLTDGDTLRLLASKGPTPDLVRNVEALPINRDSLSGRAVLEQRTIQVPDLLAAGADYPLSHDIAERFGHRTVLVVAALSRGQAVRDHPAAPPGSTAVQRARDRARCRRSPIRRRSPSRTCACSTRRRRRSTSSAPPARFSPRSRARSPIRRRCSSASWRAASACSPASVGHRSIWSATTGSFASARYHGPGRGDDCEQMYPFPIDENSATGVGDRCTSRVVHFPDVDGDTACLARAAMAAWQVHGHQGNAIGAPMLWEGKASESILVTSRLSRVLSPTRTSRC